jgi:hypothetical protein
LFVLYLPTCVSSVFHWLPCSWAERAELERRKKRAPL